MTTGAGGGESIGDLNRNYPIFVLFVAKNAYVNLLTGTFLICGKCQGLAESATIEIMDTDDTPSLNSAPTMPGGGSRPPVFDEPSLGSAPTMTPGGAGMVPAASSLGRIDQYDLVRKLGCGGFGVVYLARDTVSGVEVALKTLHPLLKSNAEEMERLREKFALVHGLTHQNIAKALVLHPVRDIAIVDDEVGRELRLSPGDFVMVMDYAPGVTLSKWKRQFPDGKVPFDHVLEIGRQIAAALDYAHGERIVHRDIKPSNVVVETITFEAGSRIRVRILDFGLAAAIRSSMSRVSTETGDTSGTRPYMAPEQWLGKTQNGRTDQYALACVLYELISGEPPFSGVFATGDPIIMKDAVARDTPENIGDIPPVVNAVLLKALGKDPKERFRSCADFIEAMSHAEARGGGGEATPGSQIPQTATSWERGHLARGTNSASDAALATDVLRRKLALSRNLMAIPEAVRTDAEFATYVSAAEDEIAVTEEAVRLDKFGAAEESLNRGEAELNKLRKALFASEKAEAERKAHEATERKAEAESIAALCGKSAGERNVVHVGSQDVALRWCPPGTFLMGSPTSEDGRYDDEILHQVTLTRGFWIGETEVTQGLWKEVMGENPSYFKNGDDFPVESVSWDMCQTFIKRLNDRSNVKKARLRFSLPTEAQWEYACRAGTIGAYGGTGRLNDMGWSVLNSGDNTHPVSQKLPNAWGLYDMHGNVWEWCADRDGDYQPDAATDPAGPSTGSYRVYRGGSWGNDACECRSAIRAWDFPTDSSYSLGFRIILLPVYGGFPSP